MDGKCKNCISLKEKKVFDAGSEDFTDSWKVELRCVNEYSKYKGCLVDYNHVCIDFGANNL